MRENIIRDNCGSEERLVQDFAHQEAEKCEKESAICSLCSYVAKDQLFLTRHILKKHIKSEQGQAEIGKEVEENIVGDNSGSEGSSAGSNAEGEAEKCEKESAICQICQKDQISLTRHILTSDCWNFLPTGRATL